MIGGLDFSIANANKFLLVLQLKAQFPFIRNCLRCLRWVRWVNENRKKNESACHSQSWLILLRSSISIGWRLRLLRENFTQQ